MPHLILEYSKNLESAVDIDGLLKQIHDVAVSLDALPIGGIRTRAVARERYRIADGHQDNSFIYVVLRIGKGRPLDVQKTVGERLFAALTAFVQPVYEQQALSLGLEIQEIEPETRWKQSNIRDYLKQRGT